MPRTGSAQEMALKMIQSQGALTQGMGFKLPVMESLSASGLVHLEMQEADPDAPDMARWTATIPAGDAMITADKALSSGGMTMAADDHTQITDNIERIRSLTQAGDADAAQELKVETESLVSAIKGTGAVKLRKEFRDAMAEAEREPVAEVARPDDYRTYAGVEQLVEQGTKRLADAVALNMKTGEVAREVASLILDMRRRITSKNGVPDLLAKSFAAKEAARVMYSTTGENLSGDPYEVEQAVRKLIKAVQYQMSDVMVGYIRGLDTAPEEASAHFSRAVAAFPDLSPSEAVWAFYESVGDPLPRRSQQEVSRARWAERNALAERVKAGEVVPAPPEDESTPDERVTSVVSKLMRNVASVKPEDFESASEETRAAARQKLEELKKAVTAMLAAAL